MRNIPMFRLPRMNLFAVFQFNSFRFLISRFQIGTALIAMPAAYDIPMFASRARFLDAAGWHRDKTSFAPFNDFDVPDDKAIVKGNSCECAQFFVVIFFLKNSDFGDFHKKPNKYDRQKYEPDKESASSNAPHALPWPLSDEC
jgi:hypothetical protein